MSTLHLGTNADPTKNITITPDGTGNLVVRDGTGTALATIEPGDFTAGTNRLSEKLDTDQKIVTGTPVTLTNQTFVDFAIPSWAKRITAIFSGVSTNGSSELCVQMGTSGGLETTGYFSRVVLAPSAAANVDKTLTTGIVAAAASPAAVNTSRIQIEKYSDNSWSGSITNAREDSGVSGSGTCRKTLSDTLTTVRITTVNGTDQFDAGTVNVMWE